MRRAGKNRSLFVCALVFFSSIALLFDFGARDVRGAVLTVDDDGTAMYLNIQDAVNDAVPGDTIYVYNGTYYENVIIDKSILLVGEDRDATIINGTFSGITVSVANVDNATIANFTLKGGVTGLEIEKSSNITIVNNTITQNWNATYFNSTENITLEDNRIIDNFFFDKKGGSLLPAGYGVFLRDSRNSKIINNNISYNSFYICDPMAGCDAGFSMAGGYGVILEASNSSQILNNEIYRNIGYALGAWGSGIYAEFSDNSTIMDNNLSDNGINVYGEWVNYTIVSNNTITGNAGDENQYGIWITGYHNMISQNIICCQKYTGIISSRGEDNQIENNLISYTGLNEIWQSTGIFIYSANTTIANNTLFNNQKGIWINANSFNTIDNNTITSNVETGIYLTFSATYNIISNNTINQSKYGIQLGTYLACNNTIVSNDIFENENGVSIVDNAKDNRIFHNNIINNINQSRDKGLNLWNDSYPSGGNYWSDYSPGCVDDFDGSVTPQISGSPDGICDVQYTIDADSADFYPLTYLAPPLNISARLTGLNLENVTISWNRSQDDPAKVISYAIYYSQTYNRSGLNYAYLTNISATGSSNYEFTAQSIGEGDPNNYFFFVQANETLFAKRSRAQVAKFTRILDADKQLVSIPLVQSNESIEVALQTLDYNIAWFYNNSDATDHWKSYNPIRPCSDLFRINHTMALWINVNQKSNLTVAGIVPRNTSIFLKEGWNFVGYPSFIERTVSEALNGIVYDRIEGYNETSIQKLKIFTGSDIMKPGWGYWIKVPFDQMWTIGN